MRMADVLPRALGDGEGGPKVRSGNGNTTGTLRGDPRGMSDHRVTLAEGLPVPNSVPAQPQKAPNCCLDSLQTMITVWYGTKAAAIRCACEALSLFTIPTTISGELAPTAPDAAQSTLRRHLVG